MERRIMHRIVKVNRTAVAAAWVILCFMILCVSAFSAPIGGSWQSHVQVESKAWSQTRPFRGGERAAVLAIGDHKELGVQVHVAVFDAKGLLVAEDKGENELASDFVGLVWYPPRDGEYRIEVRQTGADTNKIYIAIK
jgi:hypothetical protein